MLRKLFIALLFAVFSTHGTLAEETPHVTLSPFQPAWTKVCEAEKNICYTVRDFRLNSRNSPIVSMAVYDLQDRHIYVMRLMLPTGLRTDLGFVFSVDGGSRQKASVKVCLPTGCLAEARFNDYINSLTEGRSLQVVATTAMNKDVTFTIPLAGFRPAFDGPGLSYEEAKRRQQADELQRKRNADPKGPLSTPSDRALTPI